MASEIWKWRVKFLVSSPFGALIQKTLYRPELTRYVCMIANGVNAIDLIANDKNVKVTEKEIDY